MDADLAKVLDPEIEAKRAEAANQAWGSEQPSSTPPAPSSAADVSGGQTRQPGGPALDTLSMDDLEAELARRRGANSGVVPKTLERPSSDAS